MGNERWVCLSQHLVSAASCASQRGGGPRCNGSLFSGKGCTPIAGGVHSNGGRGALQWWEGCTPMVGGVHSNGGRGALQWREGCTQELIRHSGGGALHWRCTSADRGAHTAVVGSQRDALHGGSVFSVYSGVGNHKRTRKCEVIDAPKVRPMGTSPHRVLIPRVEDSNSPAPSRPSHLITASDPSHQGSANIFSTRICCPNNLRLT